MSSWGEAWAAAWGDSWGATTTDPNALHGTAQGVASAAATLSAVAWMSGSAAGSSTAQAYLELDMPPEQELPTAATPDFSSPGSGRRWVERQRRTRRRLDEESMLAGIV